MKDLYTAEYIEWLKKEKPDSYFTKDAIVDCEAQESIKRFNALVSKVRSEHTVIARGDDNAYDEHRDNQNNWSELSKQIRG